MGEREGTHDYGASILEDEEHAAFLKGRDKERDKEGERRVRST
jgi:hypothetical protein